MICLCTPRIFRAFRAATCVGLFLYKHISPKVPDLPGGLLRGLVPKQIEIPVSRGPAAGPDTGIVISVFTLPRLPRRIGDKLTGSASTIFSLPRRQRSISKQLHLRGYDVTRSHRSSLRVPQGVPSGFRSGYRTVSSSPGRCHAGHPASHSKFRGRRFCRPGK